MAIGANYATQADLRAYLNIDVNKVAMNPALDDALNSASREIERHCHRQFNKETAATARIYKPETCRVVKVDDFHTITGLVVKVDQGGSGTFDQTWVATDYELKPYDGVVDGQPGWPFNQVKAVGGMYFPYIFTREGVVQITAQWGWTAVPAPVKQACLILAAQTYKLADAPMGVAGFSQFSGEIRVRDLPQVESKLCKYVRSKVMVG